MKKLVTLTAAVGLAFSASAFAQTNQKTDANTSLPAISIPGFYVGAHGGVAIPDNEGVDTGFDIGGQVGYRFGNGFRLEEAFSYYRQNVPVPSEVSKEIGADVSSHVNTYTVMTNGYYDFNTGTNFIPYVGAGIGLLHDSVATSISAEGVSADTSASNGTNFAIQGIAGVAYQFNKNVAVDVQYRHLYSGDALIQHNNIVEAGLNYYFAT